MLEEPCWELPRPYQHKGIDLDTGIIGATNPIWIDGDADGQFTSARSYAETLFKDHGGDLPGLVRALASHDAATAAQVAEQLLLHAPESLAKVEADLLEDAAPQARKGFQNFRGALPEAP